VVRALTLSGTVRRSEARARGLRLVLRIVGEANTVRVRVHRMHGEHRGALVAERFRSPTSNPVRLRLADAALRRRLTPGRYPVEVAAGTSRRVLGAVATRTFRVVR
jgi:hypothetical protein